MNSKQDILDIIEEVNEEILPNGAFLTGEAALSKLSNWASSKGIQFKEKGDGDYIIGNVVIFKDYSGISIR